MEREQWRINAKRMRYKGREPCEIQMRMRYKKLNTTLPNFEFYNDFKEIEGWEEYEYNNACATRWGKDNDIVRRESRNSQHRFDLLLI